MNQNDKTTFSVQLNDFDGPLDVLEQLIKQKRMDILDLDISLLTQEYLKFINKNLNVLPIDNLGEYLLMSAYLLELKSKKMFPSYDNQIGSSFEYERDKLVQRINQYRQYKNVAIYLEKKRNKRNRMHAKYPDDFDEFYEGVKIIDKLPKQVVIDKLADAMVNVLEKFRYNLFSRRKIIVQEISVDEVKEDFMNFLEKQDDNWKCNFFEYFNYVDDLKLNNQYVVTTFLALLELVKYRYINLDQEDDEIKITKLSKEEQEREKNEF